MRLLAVLRTLFRMLSRGHHRSMKALFPVSEQQQRWLQHARCPCGQLAMSEHAPYLPKSSSGHRIWVAPRRSRTPVGANTEPKGNLYAVDPKRPRQFRTRRPAPVPEAVRPPATQSCLLRYQLHRLSQKCPRMPIPRPLSFRSKVFRSPRPRLCPSRALVIGMLSCASAAFIAEEGSPSALSVASRSPIWLVISAIPSRSLTICVVTVLWSLSFSRTPSLAALSSLNLIAHDASTSDKSILFSFSSCCSCVMSIENAL